MAVFMILLIVVTIIVVILYRFADKQENTLSQISQPPQKRTTQEAIPKEFEEMFRKAQQEVFNKKHLTIEEKSQRIIDEDTKDFSKICKASKDCMTIVVSVLKTIQGGQSVINKIIGNLDLYKKEFAILIASYNRLFSDKNGRGYFADTEKYNPRNGAYRLCKILRLATSASPNIKIEECEVDEIEERIEFYKMEIDYINTAQFGLPIHLLYALFNPQEKINPANAITEIGLLECVFLWKVILEKIKI